MTGALWRRRGALPHYDHTMPPLSCIHIALLGRWPIKTCFAAGWAREVRVAPGAGASSVTGTGRPCSLRLLPSGLLPLVSGCSQVGAEFISHTSYNCCTAHPPSPPC